jgi:hypothetical protein
MNHIYGIFILLILQGCYSFSGISIDPEVKTYYVHPFTDNTDNSLPNLAQNMGENLKEKIRTESRLIFSEYESDLEFKGVIVNYKISSEAPRPGEITAINRLTIVTAIEYIDNKDSEKNWKRNFQFFYDFPSDTDFASVQDQAIETITKQIMEDVFNAAFTNW